MHIETSARCSDRHSADRRSVLRWWGRLAKERQDSRHADARIGSGTFGAAVLRGHHFVTDEPSEHGTLRIDEARSSGESFVLVDEIGKVHRELVEQCVPRQVDDPDGFGNTRRYLGRIILWSDAVVPEDLADIGTQLDLEPVQTLPLPPSPWIGLGVGHDPVHGDTEHLTLVGPHERLERRPGDRWSCTHPAYGTRPAP